MRALNRVDEPANSRKYFCSQTAKSLRGLLGPIMECQAATAYIADYLTGSLPIDELEALLTHAAACDACSDKLTAAEETWPEPGRIPPVLPDLSALRRRFNAVLAEYQVAPGGRRRNVRPPRCATCSFPGQSCSWICRVRFS